MKSRLRALPLVIVAMAMFTPLGVGSARATGCDTNPGDVTRVAWSSGRTLAPNGTLATKSNATAALTAYNSSGVCVQGAQVSMDLRAVPGGGAVWTSTPTCPLGTVTAAAKTCTTDSNGTIPIQYTTGAALPNDGTDYIDAGIASSTAAQTTGYTYGSMRASAGQVTATEGAAFTTVVASVQLYNFAIIPAVRASIDWGDGTTSAGSVTGAVPGSPGPAAGTFASMTVSGTHTYAEESASALPVQVTLSAPTAATVVAAGSATVADAPLQAAGSATTTVKRRASTSIRLATFTDADAGGVPADYTVGISWGDGTTGPGSVTSSGTGFAVSGTHTYTKAATYRPAITITDVGGAHATATTTVKVTTSGR